MRMSRFTHLTDMLIGKYRLRATMIGMMMVCWSGAAMAQQTVTIVDHITAIEGNTVTQPSKLTELLAPADAPVVDTTTQPEKPAVKHQATWRMAGYRVQVYSDGNQRNAKKQTQLKASQVARRFPNMRTYISYSAPFWRLRVGDFRSRSEAESAASQLRQAFPAFRNEIRIVRDRVNIKD